MQPSLDYEQLKISYQKFQQNLPKDEFTRWYRDIGFLNSLLNFAKKANLEKDIVEFQKRKDIACSKLEELGYNIKK